MSTQATGAGPREVFSDVRGPSRMLRTSWHPEDAVVVLSVWDDDACLATFRLPAAQVPDLVGVLTRGLAGLAEAPAIPVPQTGAFAAPEPRGELKMSPGPAPRPNPPPSETETRTSTDRDSVLAQVAGRARTELTHGARRALDGIGHGALTLRDRFGRDA